MTNPAEKLSETLSSIDSIKSYLAGLVSAAFDGRGGQPVRLTYVGGEFAKATGVTFEKHLMALAESDQIAVPHPKRKLAPFVRAYCKDIFAVTEDPPGVYFVSPLASAEGAAVRVPTPHAAATLRFHRAVWAAFIRPLEGKRRFLNLDNIGFSDAAEIPTEGSWREIEERFILGVAPNSPVDGVELQSRIEEWASHAEIPFSRLVVDAKPSGGPSRHLEQLLDIIDALPSPIAAEWSIPAAVLKHLRNSR
jgi:hypothetical protein